MDIFNAIKTGRISDVKEYILNNGDINIRDSYCMTPLIVATDEGQVEISDLLIKANSNINAQDKIGQTALHIAAGRNYVEIIKMLIKANADLNIKANNGLNAYQYASENGNDKAAFILKRYRTIVRK